MEYQRTELSQQFLQQLVGEIPWEQKMLIVQINQPKGKLPTADELLKILNFNLDEL